MPASQPKPLFKTDDEVICLINYSKLYYIDNQEVRDGQARGL